MCTLQSLLRKRVNAQYLLFLTFNAPKDQFDILYVGTNYENQLSENAKLILVKMIINVNFDKIIFFKIRKYFVFRH